MTYNFLKSLYSDLIEIISGLVIKRQDLAKAAETTESIKAFEEYLACVNGTRYFFTFRSFDIDVLRKYYTKETASLYRSNPGMIPEKDRDLIVKDQAEVVISTYKETNEYYRMLMGLPSLEDRNWIYIRDQDDIPSDIPIHELTIEQISRLETRGTIDRLKEEYPDRDYLNYLGANSIDLIEARLARPFEILRTGTPVNPRTTEMFKEQYYYARRYILATSFNRSEMTTKTLYDPIVGIIMLTLAVRNTLVPNERDYLNFEEILDAILESYGFLDYFQDLPFTYKQRLVLALDHLLMIKGTDQVLVDVCKIFSNEGLITNRFYLLKYQKKDENGNVIFTPDPNAPGYDPEHPDRQPVDPDNPDNTDPNYGMKPEYTTEFIKSDIVDHDIDYSEENRSSYDSVTDADYLWQIGDEEKKKLDEEDFNLIITKYVDVEAAYDTSELVFEICCFINLLLYARENIAKITLDNAYATDGKSSLFTMLVFLLAAMAQRSHFDGNIVYSPADIAQIWRFNYGDIQEQLRAIVDKYELRVDVSRTLVEGFEMELDAPYNVITEPSRLLTIYANNRALYKAIQQEMRDTNDIDHYIALAQCRDILFTSCTEQKSFTKSDGTVASTYYEMLEDLDPKLARRLDSVVDDDDALNVILVHTLEQLEFEFNGDTLKYLFLNTSSMYSALIGKYLETAINVFKAHLIQLRSINMLFYFGDQNPIRIIDHIHYSRSRTLHDEIHVDDDVTLHKKIFFDDYIGNGDKIYLNTD